VALDSGDPLLRTLNPFLDKIAVDGFNFIILNAFAYDTSWRKGRTEDDDYGPPPLYAWEARMKARPQPLQTSPIGSTTTA